MTKIYLIRHAEVDNPRGIYYGRLPNFGLSQDGIRQAKELKKYFKNKNISRIYSSPLLRARKTAEIISGGKIPISYSPKLLESDLKKWEGTEYDKRDPEEVEDFVKDPIRSSAALGESYLCVQQRMLDKVFEILEKHNGENIIVVSHADPIITVKLYFEKKSLFEITKVRLRNASITTLFFDNKLECKQVEYKEIVDSKEPAVYERRNLERA